MCVCTGGEGKTGKVVDVLDWSNEGGSVYEVSVCCETFTRVLNSVYICYFYIPRTVMAG